MRQEKDRDRGEVVNRAGKLRLFVRGRLNAGAIIAATAAQAHYLLHVMRARAGSGVRLFNGQDGEWRARIAELGKGACILVCEDQTESQSETPDLWLLFAPIKKTPADYVAQKATELGARLLQPVITRRTIVTRVNLDRLAANAIEAAEQSGRLSVPEIREAVALDWRLKNWPPERRLVFCDEGGDAEPIGDALARAKNTAGDAWAVITGPEGGFDAEERATIRKCPSVIPVTLGPRIIRADTAALAALAVWQALLGDWH